ncbi:hypothetical protein [Cellulomonas sp. Y8]|uniref:hypothetical protein n=1 Tax=Cellulomonas sp. Y8 TaxID=2591145 RepID=UPI003D7416AF
MIHLRPAAKITIGFLAAVTLVACTPPAARWPAREVGDLQIPQVDWPQGAPDTGNPAVEALVNALIALAAATNNRDMSPEGLRRYVAEEYLGFTARGLARKASEGRYSYYPGPLPIRVSSIDEERDRARVKITACAPTSSQWRATDTTAIEPNEFISTLEGHVIEFLLVPDEDESLKLYADMESSERCSLGNARVGFFDPPPDLVSVPSTQELVMPDGTPANEGRLMKIDRDDGTE